MNLVAMENLSNDIAHYLDFLDSNTTQLE